MWKMIVNTCSEVVLRNETLSQVVKIILNSSYRLQPCTYKINLGLGKTYCTTWTFNIYLIRDSGVDLAWFVYIMISIEYNGTPQLPIYLLENMNIHFHLTMHLINSLNLWYISISLVKIIAILFSSNIYPLVNSHKLFKMYISFNLLCVFSV